MQFLNNLMASYTPELLQKNQNLRLNINKYFFSKNNIKKTVFTKLVVYTFLLKYPGSGFLVLFYHLNALFYRGMCKLIYRIDTY